MKKRGVGYACSAQGANYHFGHNDSSNVELQVLADNTLLMRTAASDIGQGLETVLINIASITLNGFPTDKIRWEGSNTEAPEAGGTGASRQSTITGNALYQACLNKVCGSCDVAVRVAVGAEVRLAHHAGLYKVPYPFGLRLEVRPEGGGGDAGHVDFEGQDFHVSSQRSNGSVSRRKYNAKRWFVQGESRVGDILPRAINRVQLSQRKETHAPTLDAK